jgi:tetratricopeptide (TPR) repeat protein
MDDKYEKYYDAMEYLNAGNIAKAKKLLKEILQSDVEFIDAYNGLAAAYEDEKNKKKARESADVAFKLIKEKFLKWPKEMHWGELDNRPYLRAICNKAIYLHEDGKIDEAEKLYRLLLKLNPGDNQGARYLLAALFAGKQPQIVVERIASGNELQHWNKMEKLLGDQNKKHKFWSEEGEF